MILTTTAIIAIISSSTTAGIGIGTLIMYIKKRRDEDRFELYDEPSYDELVDKIYPFKTI